MNFKHLVAFGNSDQASFRQPDVRESFDIMTVPGTIASYYQEATAAFVLSSQIPYLIDPRTPLFQGNIAEPRASHITLASWHGEAVQSAVVGRVPVLDPSFYTQEVIADVVTTVIEKQRNYADHAPLVQKKLDRYALLLAEAMQEQGAIPPTRDAQPPVAILSPYFAVSGESDPWWNVMQRVWEAASGLANPGEISPVLCVDGRSKQKADGVTTLADVLPHLPSELSDVAYFWITNFDERKVSAAQLLALWNLIVDRPDGRLLVNLYGGFFSICLRNAGLHGFGNGLTYSESRDWPALASTGAAPPRYYVRDLHVFMSQAVAASLEQVDPSFACQCIACIEWRLAGESIASLPYHELKRHFALARKWELEVTAAAPPRAIAAQLEEAQRRVVAASSGSVVLAQLPSTDFLSRWASVLRSVS